jgi:hypothetical protein
MPEGRQAAEAPLAAPLVGVWDQWCVLGERPYSKEGDQSLMDEAACRQFLVNFRGSPDDLPCNIGHDKSKVVGWYNALALFIGGACVDFASHDPAAGQPALDDLPGGDDGSPPNDGVYWRRSRLTDLGIASHAYLRKVSPEFYMRGKNQFEEEVGPLAVGGAWTNYPFLPGCEKHEFEKREPAMATKKMSYAARCYEEAGVGKDDDDKVKFSKVSAYWRGKHGAEYAKYEEDAGVGKDDDEPTRMTKMMSYMGGRASMEAAGADQEPAEMTGPTVSVKGGEPNKDPVNGPASMERSAAFQAFARDLGLPQDPAAARAKMQAYQAAAQELPKLNQQVTALAAEAAERKKGEQRAEAQEFTREAWRKGQIRPRQSETHAAAQGRIMQLYARSGKEAAEAALLEPGSFTPPEAMVAPLMFSNDRPAAEAARPDDEILRRSAERMKAAGIEPKNKQGVYDYRLSQYAREVCQEDPTLARRYANQSRAALFEGLA